MWKSCNGGQSREGCDGAVAINRVNAPRRTGRWCNQSIQAICREHRENPFGGCKAVGFAQSFDIDRVCQAGSRLRSEKDFLAEELELLGCALVKLYERFQTARAHRRRRGAEISVEVSLEFGVEDDGLGSLNRRCVRQWRFDEYCSGCAQLLQGSLVERIKSRQGVGLETQHAESFPAQRG